MRYTHGRRRVSPYAHVRSTGMAGSHAPSAHRSRATIKPNAKGRKTKKVNKGGHAQIGDDIEQNGVQHDADDEMVTARDTLLGADVRDLPSASGSCKMSTSSECLLCILATVLFISLIIIELMKNETFHAHGIAYRRAPLQPPTLLPPTLQRPPMPLPPDLPPSIPSTEAFPPPSPYSPSPAPFIPPPTDPQASPPPPPLQPPLPTLPWPPGRPPPPPASPIMESLNARWHGGKPSNDLAAGGVVMWVVDGDGRDLNGFDATTPWRPIDNPTGDRHSASLVSKRHPYIFACFACWDDFRFNPGLVLAPSQATKDRLMCSYHQDIGSYRYKCPSYGRSEGCSPGCAPVVCGEDPPYRTWSCSWRPTALKRMMESHDSIGQGYNGPVTGDSVQQFYNELVFDAFTKPWEDDLASMIEAVFVQARGTPGATENGRRLHRSVLELTGASPITIPLLQYDPSMAADPFTPIS